jgi:heme/copper-type cytochrome/quinol oxidase subunit 3
VNGLILAIGILLGLALHRCCRSYEYWDLIAHKHFGLLGQDKFYGANFYMATGFHGVSCRSSGRSSCLSA